MIWKHPQGCFWTIKTLELSHLKYYALRFQEIAGLMENSLQLPLQPGKRRSVSFLSPAIGKYTYLGVISPYTYLGVISPYTYLGVISPYQSTLHGMVFLKSDV